MVYTNHVYPFVVKLGIVDWWILWLYKHWLIPEVCEKLVHEWFFWLFMSHDLPVPRRSSCLGRIPLEGQSWFRATVYAYRMACISNNGMTRDRIWSMVQLSGKLYVTYKCFNSFLIHSMFCWLNINKSLFAAKRKVQFVIVDSGYCGWLRNPALVGRW